MYWYTVLTHSFLSLELVQTNNLSTSRKAFLSSESCLHFLPAKLNQSTSIILLVIKYLWSCVENHCIVPVLWSPTFILLFVVEIIATIILLRLQRDLLSRAWWNHYNLCAGNCCTGRFWARSFFFQCKMATTGLRTGEYVLPLNRYLWMTGISARETAAPVELGPVP